MRKIIPILLFVQCLFLACEEEIGLLDAGAEAPRLVVNALCSTADSVHTVYLYRTGLTSSTPVSSANVTLAVNGQEVEQVAADGGVCRLKTTFAADDEVCIKVQAGDDEASATTQVPRPLEILGYDTLHVQKHRDFNSSDIDYYIRFMIRVRLADGVAGTQFFRLTLDREACFYYVQSTYRDLESDCRVERISAYDIFDRYKSPNKYEYDFDPALNENAINNETEEGVDWFDSAPNDYGLFRSSYFQNGEYTLYIDVEDLWRYYGGDAGRKDICTFRIHSIPKSEYYYLWAVDALWCTYEPGVLLSNPPIVPTNIDGGTGIFSVSANATLRYEDIERKVAEDGVIQHWPEDEEEDDDEEDYF